MVCMVCNSVRGLREREREIQINDESTVYFSFFLNVVLPRE